MQPAGGHEVSNLQPVLGGLILNSSPLTAKPAAPLSRRRGPVCVLNFFPSLRTSRDDPDPAFRARPNSPPHGVGDRHASRQRIPPSPATSPRRARTPRARSASRRDTRVPEAQDFNVLRRDANRDTPASFQGGHRLSRETTRTLGGGVPLSYIAC